MSVGVVIVAILLLILIDYVYLYKESSLESHLSAGLIWLVTLFGTYYMAVKGSDSLFEVIVKGGLVGGLGYSAFNRDVVMNLGISDHRTQHLGIYSAMICSATAALLYLV